MITEEIWKDIPGYEGLYQALKSNETAYGFTWQEV